ncbi:MAG: sodium:solute symporter family protein [Verrucomicrobia bacterium]|nr:sodium:solute symporter family protein [Verrucomicrobiota bacterium]
MNVYTITILISVLAYVVVGNFVGRKVKGLEDYFVVSRQAPVLLIVGTLVASFLSTNTFMGQAGFNYDKNAALVLAPGILLCGYIYGALYFGRYLRRSRALTVAEYFAKRFNSRRVQIVAGITVIVGIGFYLIAVSQAVALIISNLTPLTYNQALIVAWASYTSFTLYAGSRGVVITDTMMFMLFSVVTLLAMVAIFNVHGGWFAAMDGLVHLEGKEDLMAWHGITGPDLQFQTPADFLIWFIIIMIAWSFVTAISPWQSSRYLMAKNEQVVLRSACAAAICIGVIQAMVYAAAPVVNLSNAAIEPRDEVLVWAALNLMSPLVGALLLAGLVAAALSSASTFLSLIGFNLSHDFLHERGKDDRAKLKFSRQMMLVSGLLILVASLSLEQNIFWFTYFAGTLFASAWGPVAIMSVWSSRITASAAFWGITCGFLGNSIPKLLVSLDVIKLPVYLDPIVIGAVISLVVVLMVSSKTTVTEAERSYRLSMLETPKEELNIQEAKITMRYASAVGVFGIAMTLIMLIFYVSPYQKALAPAGVDYSFDWFSGEAIFAYAWAVLFVFIGWLMHRGVRKDYVSK